MDRKKKKGAVGIGTLIIFIAMVLVAAVAAAVLINVSGILHQRSMETGKEAINTVTSNIMVTYIIGQADGNYSNLNIFYVVITAAAGAGEIDVAQMIIRVGNGVNETIQKYANGDTYAADGENFTATELRDPNNLFTNETAVIDGSSLIRLNIVPSSATIPVLVPVRTPITIIMIPEFGNMVKIEVTTPATYSRTLIDLYP